jgi:hypothetical protein
MSSDDVLGPAPDWGQECLKWHGRVLTGLHAHWCWSWDGLPIDETCTEYEACQCYTPEQKAEVKAKNIRLP